MSDTEVATHNPRFPEQVVTATEEREGLRYLFLGEDSERLVILGHPAAEAALVLVAAVSPWFDDEGELCAEELARTWARRLTACPQHAQEQQEEGCQYCDAGDMTEHVWLDWQDGETKRNEPGYFPIVIWDMYA